MEYYVCKACVELSKIYINEENYKEALKYIEKVDTDCHLYEDILNESKHIKNILIKWNDLDSKLKLSIRLYKEGKFQEAFENICEVVRDSKNFPHLWEQAILIITDMLRDTISN